MTSARYDAKQPTYFASARTEVFDLLPAHMERVLELGCGTGATLAALRAAGRCKSTMGIELFESAGNEAKKIVDHVIIGDVEKMDDLGLEPSSFDAILCCDVLEHLVDPWRIVKCLSAALRPNGVLVASIPNVQHIRVIVPLLFGTWKYTDHGLLDHTHLRFFTRASAVELIASGGLDVDRVDANISPRGRWMDRLTLGAFSHFSAVQYFVRGTKRN